MSLVAGLLVLNQDVIAVAPGNEAGFHSGRHSQTVHTPKTRFRSTPDSDRMRRAEAAIRAGDRVLAISIFREIVMLEPNNLEVRLTLAAALADAEKFDEARSHLEFIQKIRPAWVQIYLTRGTLERQARNDISALKAYNQALALEPSNRTARAGRLLAMSRLGSPDLALTEASRYPELDPDILQRLHEDQAALAIRRSENAYHEKPNDTLKATDTALRLVQANLQRYPKSERSLFDSVRALTNRRRYQEAITLYEVLKREKPVLPGYIHQAAGASYLAEHLPEQASAAYTAALAADPDNFDASVGLFYALCDANHFAKARAHSDAWAARPLDPEKKFSAEILVAWERAYEGRLGAAHERFAGLQARAPASAELHKAVGTVYLWRGWPRRAQQEFELVVQDQNDDVGANAGLVDGDIALGDFRAAARRIAYLNTLDPDNESIKKLNRVQALRESNELNITAGTSRNRDRATTGPSLRFDTRVYTKPVNFQHRIYAHEYFESSHFDADSAYYKRLGLGLESIIPRTAKLEIEIQQEFFRRSRTSAVFNGVFQLNDFWHIEGRFDSNSIDVPLRARLIDIHGRSFYLGTGYRWNEGAAISVATQQVSMSDDNRRRSLSMTAEDQFIQGPFYTASLVMDIGTSTNTLQNTVYFNPARDRALQLTLKNEWLGFRRYARSFYQRLYMSGGSYTQQDYSAQTIGSLRYEHEWNFSEATSTRYSLAYVRRAFDGAPSTGPEATLSLNWKF